MNWIEEACQLVIGLAIIGVAACALGFAIVYPLYIVLGMKW